MSLPNKIYDLESFQEEFLLLWKDSVQKLFPNILGEDSNLFSKSVDWNYLLTCASILAQSSEAKHQSAALRIAQNCLTDKETNEAQKVGATVIFDKLTNRQALELAVSREYLSKDYASKVPLPLIVEQTRRDIKQIIFTKDKKEYYLNKFQRIFYEKAEQIDHISASAPTSAGKSFVLNLFVLEKLRGSTSLNVVYIVPTRALITQVERDLSNALSESNLTNVYISSIPQVPKQVSNVQSRIFVFTQERLHWLLADNRDFKVDFLIIDEAQKIGDGGRGVLLQQKIEELVSQWPKLRILFCSAHTENPEILLTGLGANSSTQAIQADYVAVNQNLLRVSRVKGKSKEWIASLSAEKKQLELGSIVFGKPLSETEKLPVFSHRLGSPEGGNMIYVNGQADAENAAEYLYNLVGTQAENSDEEIEDLIALTKKVIHPEYSLCKVLKRGIAFHYGNMPQAVKNKIEDLFTSGKVKYLVCTSTLLEGVNLPAKSIFLRKPKRGKDTPLSEDDFWNLAGRVGRLKHEFQGNIICIDPEEWNVPTEKKRFFIKRAVTEISKNNVAFIEYIKKGTPRSEINDEFEYVLSYYYNRFLKEGSLSNTPGDPEFLKELQAELKKIKGEINIPPEIIYRNPGISPLAQQNL